MTGVEVQGYYRPKGCANQAAGSIQKAFKKRKSPSKQSKVVKEVMTPVSKHYDKVSRDNNQPSILAFRRQCNFFPHPVEIYSGSGISFPMDKNYAKIWAKDSFAVFTEQIGTYFEMKDWQHINKTYSVSSKYDDFKIFENNEWRWSRPNKKKIFPNLKNGHVTIGLLHVVNDLGAHLLFYELRVEENRPHAIILDPNGLSEMYDEELTRFFHNILFTISQILNINAGEKNIAPYLKRIGIQNNADELEGYCATISTYYFIDYMCTNQWVKRDISHFVRASEEWMYSLDEQKYGLFSKIGVHIKVVLFGRYLAYHLCRLFLPEKVKKSNLTTIWFATRQFSEYIITIYIQTKSNEQEKNVTFEDDDLFFITKPEGTRLLF